MAETRMREALQGVSVFSRSRRKAVREAVVAAATRDAEILSRREHEDRAREQAILDAEWAALIAHQPEQVFLAFEDAFEDNQSPSACVDVGVDGNVRYATVLVVFGSIDLVPDRKADLTPSGKPTIHKRTKTERNELYSAALGSTVLATVKEGFAVAPSVDEIRIVVVKKDPHAPSPDRYVEPIYAARFTRSATERMNWHHLNPAEELLRAQDAQIQRKGVTGEIVAIPIADEPGITELVAAARHNL